MSRVILSLVGVVSLMALALADDVKPSTEFGKDIRVPANTGFVAVVSEDKKSAELIFDNLFVEVNPAVKGAAGTLNQTAIQSKVFTVNIPYSTDQRSVTMNMDIRGFAMADPAASVRLVACAGGTTKVVDLTMEKGKTVKLKGKSKAALAPRHANDSTGDFVSRIEFTVQSHAKNPVGQITLFLVAEHNTDKADAGGALLVIDSLDVEVNRGGKAAIAP